ncbi:phosphatidylserine decarboxylase [Thermostaphylospora chromogena]|uniref:Phosphatidylserine decarboxylase proenzyme n=1 Tax=Thermostaphylospora chromogena TaxID=35622 RepID=A0A1H1HLA5_9ACTN|nr:phosphatidylserine decarboxylase [Thermostaphylospora chromogena]SDR26305.1 phosphatidylserine decarboxylase [Thermostaphylospora chromogena]
MSHDSSSPAIGRIRLARGVSPWLVPTAAAAAVTSFLTRRDRRWALAAVPLTALTGGMLWFFRDPERTLGPGRILAPADGVVQSIDPQPDGRTRVAVFMSPLDVHVNRAPLAGTVTSVEHVAGGFLPAFNKDSDRNERVVWHFDTALGDIELVQIAGAVARRIVPYLTAGAKVARGERIGLIRLGSRVDVYLPEGIAPAVTVGQRTIAGVTGLDHG